MAQILKLFLVKFANNNEIFEEAKFLSLENDVIQFHGHSWPSNFNSDMSFKFTFSNRIEFITRF